jgi:hypothetical protein
MESMDVLRFLDLSGPSGVSLFGSLTDLAV